MVAGIRDCERMSVGGIVRHNDRVLLVKHTYGPTKGRWDFPRGYVMFGESPEVAIVRELAEEAGIEVTPVGIIAIRHQATGDVAGCLREDTCIIWLLDHTAAELNPDGREIEDAVFSRVDDALDSPDVSSWAKELIRVARRGTGLMRSTYIPQNIRDQQKCWSLYTV